MLSLNSNAQDINVAPGFNTLSDAVTANQGSTFILERGGIYIVDVDVVVDAPSIFKAAGDETLSPPVVQYYANPGESASKQMFLVGASTTFEGIGFQGFTPLNEQVGKALVSATEDSIQLVFDGCVFQGAKRAISFGGNGMSYTLKNNVFFNSCNVGWDNYGGYISLWGGTEVDYQVYNNTYFMTGRLHNAAGAGPLGTESMNHNTYVNTWGDTYYPTSLQNVIVTNNMYYNAQIRGYVGLLTNADGDTTWVGDFRDWNLDSLVGDIAIFPHEYDSLDNDNPRQVSITNNVKMYDQKVMDFYADNNVTPMTLWNHHGRDIYGPRYGWEFTDNYLQEDGNAIDPEFAMGDLPDSVYTYAFLERQERHLPGELQGPDFPYTIVWLPDGAKLSDFIWPLPFDFKPTNMELWHLGSDGYPIGDLNWFGDDVVAAWEAGEDNTLPTSVDKFQVEGLELKTYPNPFSSTTMISYNLPSDGKVSISIYNVSGALVAQLVNEQQSIGEHEIVFDAANLSSGIYFCKVQMGSYNQVEKMSIIK